MTSEVPSPAAEAPPSWPVLTLHERRVLGVMVEKAKTTPDVYPLSVNALVTGCNQKSNRDPVLDLSDVDVDDTLAGLQKRAWAIKITGGRVTRWRHALYEAWRVDKVELAVLAELLLRGPQTEGELRSRASRMEPIDDLDTLRAVLKRLAERRLVVYLTPEGRRGTMVTHGFHAPEELDRLRSKHRMEAESAAPEPERTGTPAPRPAAAATPALESRLNEVQAEVANLKQLVAELQVAVSHLAEDLRTIKNGLGV
jgi:hypothetical protein